MNELDYWKECIISGLDEIGVSLLPEQITKLAKCIQISHENIGMAFYTPPTTDRLEDLEREYNTKLKKIEKEFDQYQSNAENMLKKVLNFSKDTTLRIHEDGVYRICGRSEKVL